MSLVVRFVDTTNNEISVNESFLGFFILEKKDAESISISSMAELDKYQLDIMDCRCFCSDNANVMAGNISGLQTIFRQKNELSLFMNCNNHSLNLVGVHAVSEEPIMGSFFACLDSLYNYFSRSTLRWARLTKTLNITLKRECETRWSSRKEAVTIVYKNVKEILKLLLDMSNDINENSLTRSEAYNLHVRLLNYDFLILIKFWNDILPKIDLVQKLLQNKKILFKDAAQHIKSLKTYFTDKRETIVSDCLDAGKTLCNELGISVEKRKRSGTLTPLLEMERAMKSSLDRICIEMDSRFKRLMDLDENFGFFLDIEKLCYGEHDSDELGQKCELFGSIYKKDCNGNELFQEISDLRMLLKEKGQMEIETALDVLKFISQFEDESLLPNLSITLRILCTMPVSIASCERSFSKLKLILTYLRSTMDTIRLSDLAFLSIEAAEVEETDLTEMINEFANAKCRKKAF